MPRFLELSLNEEVFHSFHKDFASDKDLENWRKDIACHLDYFEQVLRNYQKDNPYSLDFAIVSSGNLVGGISCVDINSVDCLKNGEVSYWLGRDYWGKGIATQVLGDFSNWLFDKQDFYYLSAITSETNLGSQKVLEKNGFALEKILSDNKRMYFRYRD